MTVSIRKNILLLLCVLPLFSLYSREALTKSTDLGIVFTFKTDQDRYEEEYFFSGADLKFYSEPMDDFKIRLELEVSLLEVELQELWFSHKAPGGTLKYGTFQNEILFEDQISSKDSLFASDSLIQNRLKDMGWYSTLATGIEYKRQYNNEKRWGGYVHSFFNYTNHEVVFDGAVYFPFSGKKSYAGFSGAYFPYIYHELWLSNPGIYEREHYYLYNVFIAQLSKNSSFIYKLEVSSGTNKLDPIGYLHYPGGGGESWFLGIDAFLGKSLVDKKDFSWSPGVNFSYLMHDTGEPEANTVHFRYGNRLVWQDLIYLHADLGVGCNTFYDTDEQYNSDLISEWEVLWGVSFQLRY